MIHAANTAPKMKSSPAGVRPIPKPASFLAAVMAVGRFAVARAEAREFENGDWRVIVGNISIFLREWKISSLFACKTSHSGRGCQSSAPTVWMDKSPILS